MPTAVLAKGDALTALAQRARRWLHDADTNVRSIKRVRKIITDFNNSEQGRLHYASTGFAAELRPPPLATGDGFGLVYVILHQDLEYGVYVGWTIQPLQERFWQ